MKLVVFFAGALSLFAQTFRATTPRFERPPGGAAGIGQPGIDVPEILSAQASPAWVGYAEPIVPGQRRSCCWNVEADVRWNIAQAIRALPLLRLKP